MKKIPNIKITQEEYRELIRHQRFSLGAESIICRTEREQTLYKFFISASQEEIENKLNKVKALYRKKIEHSVHPVSTVSMDGKIIGYEMTYDQEYIPLTIANLSRKQQIEMLRQTKTILEYFNSQDITYSDIKSSNILINPKTADTIFCDMDNTRVGEYPVDLICYNLMRFYEIYGKMDNVVQAYMHNLLVLEQLGFPNSPTQYYDIIMALEEGQRPTKFKQAAAEIFDGMANPQLFNGEYAIEYIKR